MIGSLVSIQKSSVGVYGIEENFIDALKQQYYIPKLIDTELEAYDGVGVQWSDDDLITRLFYPVNPLKLKNASIPSSSTVYITDQAKKASPFLVNNLTQVYSTSIPVLISDRIAKRNYVSPNQLVTVANSLQSLNGTLYTKRYLCSIVATLQKMPSFARISGLISGNTPVLMSMNNFHGLLLDVVNTTGYKIPQPPPPAASASKSNSVAGAVYVTSDDIQANLVIPKGTLLVAVNPAAGDREVSNLLDEIAAILSSANYASSTFTITNLRDQVASTQQAASYILLMFYIVGVVGMILCFFVLFLSFTSNMRENSWEYGVLRALGVDASTVSRLYLYEALCIMFSCIVTGTITGMLTSITLTLQFNLFTELPFQFTMPATLFTLLIIASVVVSLAGSYFPAQEYAKKRIASVLKGV